MPKLGESIDGATVLSWEEPLGWPRDAERDRLIGQWHIFQRKRGHRTSTDDLITAWYAVHRSAKSPQRYLDLGCGIGSVLLMVCHRLRPATAVGIEAQPQSVAMARRAIAELPDWKGALRVEDSDFRSVAFDGDRFDLITGSPPYFPLNAGSLPDDPQRRACRFEARGGVEGYMQTASRALTDDGRFYLVFQTLWRHRVIEAGTAAGLFCTGEAEFLMREDRERPFLTVFEFRREAVETPHHHSCAVRDASGEISDGYMQVRIELGVSTGADRLLSSLL